MSNTQKPEKNIYDPQMLTPRQHRYIETMVQRLCKTSPDAEPDPNMPIKRADLKAASAEYLSTTAAPEWVTRNPHTRVKRGYYSLAHLLNLPVRDLKKQTTENASESTSAEEQASV